MAVRIELRSDEIARMMTDDTGIQSLVVAKAHSIAQAAGDGFRVKPPTPYGDRTSAFVYTATTAARYREARGGTLMKAVTSCSS